MQKPEPMVIFYGFRAPEEMPEYGYAGLVVADVGPIGKLRFAQWLSENADIISHILLEPMRIAISNGASVVELRKIIESNAALVGKELNVDARGILALPMMDNDNDGCDDYCARYLIMRYTISKTILLPTIITATNPQNKASIQQKMQSRCENVVDVVTQTILEDKMTNAHWKASQGVRDVLDEPSAFVLYPSLEFICDIHAPTVFRETQEPKEPPKNYLDDFDSNSEAKGDG